MADTLADDLSPLRIPSEDLSGARVAAVVALPWALFLAHSLPFRHWVMDDAGITFVYARNLAHGHGLVAQPGAVPVEGFSNPLWVILYAVLIGLGAFTLSATPKVVAVLLVGFAFAVLTTWLIRRSSWSVGLVACALCAVQPAFVIWTSSGLENPLYVLLTVLLLWRCDAPTTTRSAALAGALAAAIAMTRPEGLVYVIAWPTVVAFSGRLRREWVGVLSYLLVWVVLMAALVALRYSYFGDLAPNTFHAKGGPTAHLVTTKAATLSECVGGPTITLVFLGAALAAARRYPALAVFVALSGGVYLAMPADYYPEARFATPFFLFLYAAVALTMWRLLERRPRRMFGIASALVLGVTALSAIPRSEKFAADPAVPMSRVAQRYGTTFDDLARLIGVEASSVLLPDVGGTLWQTHTRVYDLAGLTTQEIAHTLRAPDRQRALVFDVIRPTFIHAHGSWANSAVCTDARLLSDYLIIENGDGWFYAVRADVMIGRESALTAMRARIAHSLQGDIWRIPDVPRAMSLTLRSSRRSGESHGGQPSPVARDLSWSALMNDRALTVEPAAFHADRALAVGNSP